MALISGIPGLLGGEYVSSYPRKWAQNVGQIPEILKYPIDPREREERGYDPYEGVVSHTIGAIPEAVWKLNPLLPIARDASFNVSGALSNLSQNIANIFDTPKMALDAGTLQPTVESVLSMMAGGKTGRPRGGLYPRKGQSMGRKREEDLEKQRSLIPPPEPEPAEETPSTPYDQYLDILNADIELTQAELAKYSTGGMPNISNPDETRTVKKYDWQSGEIKWGKERVNKGLTSQDKNEIELENKRTLESYNLWNDRLEALRNMATPISDARDGFLIDNPKWKNEFTGEAGFPPRIHGVYDFPAETVQEDIFREQIDERMSELDMKVDRFHQITSESDETRKLKEEFAGRKPRIKLERDVGRAGGVEISNIEYDAGLRQIHFNEDGSMSEEGQKLLRSFDARIESTEDEKLRTRQERLSRNQALIESRGWSISDYNKAVKEAEETGQSWEDILHGSPDESEMPPALVTEQEMYRDVTSSEAGGQVVESYEDVQKDSDEYLQHLKEEIKRLKKGEVVEISDAKIYGMGAAPPTWEHYWAYQTGYPDASLKELFKKWPILPNYHTDDGVTTPGREEDLIRATTKALLDESIEYTNPINLKRTTGKFADFYREYKEYLIEGPAPAGPPLDLSQIREKMERVTDLVRRSYRQQAQRILLEDGYISEKHIKAIWED